MNCLDNCEFKHDCLIKDSDSIVCLKNIIETQNKDIIDNVYEFLHAVLPKEYFDEYDIQLEMKDTYILDA